MTEGEAQTALAEVALVLVAIADRLQRIHDALPTAPDQDAMLEHRVPRDVATEIVATVECVLVDEIRPAIEYLEAASRVTADELRVRWEQEPAAVGAVSRATVRERSVERDMLAVLGSEKGLAGMHREETILRGDTRVSHRHHFTL